jgi:RNA polymerase sigma-70 factor, ECF subfamily
MDADDFPARIVSALPALRRYARTLMRSSWNPDVDAEDLVQDAAVRALEKRRLYAERNAVPLETWLRTVMHHLHATGVRRSVYRATYPSGGMEDLRRGREAAPDDAALGAVVADAVAALDQLAPAQLDVLLRICIDGRSYAEVVEDTGLPVGTVRSHLSRARAALRAADVL